MNPVMTVESLEPAAPNGATHITRTHRFLFWGILFVAMLLRLAAAMPESMHHYDEIGQYMDQAFRLLFGYSAVPWEYRYGMRSWLLPVLLSGPMAIGHFLAPTTNLYLLLPKLCVSLASLSIPWSAYYLGRRLSLTHGLVAMAVAAVWFEAIFFGTHILSEPLAVAAMFPAIALLSNPQAKQAHLIIAGALFGIATIFRFHYGLPILLLVLGYCWQSFQTRFLPLFAGGLLVAIVSAIVDIAMGMMPFSWLFVNIYQNIIVNRSANYGVSGPTAYLTEIARWWGIGALPIVLLVLAAYRHHRLLIWVAIINLAVHSAIGHKEYRFIFFSVAIFVVVAAIGSVNIADWLHMRLRKRSALHVPAVIVVLWGTLSASLAASSQMAPRWTSFGVSLRTMSAVGKDTSVCGLGIDDQYYWQYGSYAWLKRNIPIYPLAAIAGQDRISRLPRSEFSAYNMFIGRDIYRSRLPQTYVKSNCQILVPKGSSTGSTEAEVRVCEFRRPGGCDGRGWEAFRINDVLRANDN